MPPLVRKPLVLARVNVQEHPRQWTALTPLAVRAPPRLPLDEASALEHAFRPRVAHRDGVLTSELLVEVLHVEIKVLLAVEAQDLFKHSTGHPARAGLAAPPVEQSMEAE